MITTDLYYYLRHMQLVASQAAGCRVDLGVDIKEDRLIFRFSVITKDGRVAMFKKAMDLIQLSDRVGGAKLDDITWHDIGTKMRKFLQEQEQGSKA